MLRAGGSASQPLTGVVLCGGESSRMGFEKAFLEVDGRPIVLALAERLAEVCGTVLLATGWPGRLGDLGYPEVEDVLEYSGPLAGIVAALQASPTEMLAVVAVDMPRANPELLRYLADRLDDHHVAVPEGPRGLEPTHAVYSRRALAPLTERLHSRRLSLRGALEDLDVHVAREPELLHAGFGIAFAANINEPDDLWMLQQPGVRDR
ncbi:MAG: molybdenum cofactor guanylyltransferase [Chloroflexota bacterium]|jgi:molybdopterin-guanine dinucleotide biosynthesis protein A|nr:molybdenum cofactor guanylyltransferase [Chloroflexota bacterium]